MRLPRYPDGLISFERLVKGVSNRLGPHVAAQWVQAVAAQRGDVSLRAIERAIRVGEIAALVALVDPTRFVRRIVRRLTPALASVANAVGQQGAGMLAARGLAIGFDVPRRDLAHAARQQAAALVRDVPAETRAMIRAVIAYGAEQGITIAEQARLIRAGIGLAPAHALAPARLADELRSGNVEAATARRLSAITKQQIRARVAAGTVDEAFVSETVATYTQSLTSWRATTIARTETLRAAHHGLQAGWAHAAAAGRLPPTARRWWVVTPDARLSVQHAQIPAMNPRGRALDEPFHVPPDEGDGGRAMYPPCRPNCRCHVGLTLGDATRIRRPHAA